MIILCVGKLKSPYKELELDFLKRIKNIKIIEIKERNRGEDTKNIIKKLENLRGYKVLFDVNGELINNLSDIFEKNPILIVGGPDGFENEIKKHVNKIISISPLTFNHQLFRILLLEQIYRWQTVGPYKKH